MARSAVARMRYGDSNAELAIRIEPPNSINTTQVNHEDLFRLTMAAFGIETDATDKPPTFDLGLVPGVFLGSFLAAWLFGELKLEGFEGGASMRRYLLGALLMGFGGMLAGGCAVGAGLSGAAVFTITSWVTLTTMWAAAAITVAIRS